MSSRGGEIGRRAVFRTQWAHALESSSLSRGTMVDEVLSKVISLYNFSSQTKVIGKVKEGFLSQNFILGVVKPEYFLKEYRFDNREKVSQIHKIKYYFAQNGIPIILPVINRQENSFFEHDGKFYAIFPFISATTISRESPPDEALISSAQMLAKIHLLSKDKTPDLVADIVRGWDKSKFLSEAKIIEQIIEQTERKTDLDQKYLSTLKLKVKLAEENDIFYENLGLASDHLAHGDYHDKNIFFDKDFNLTHLFDLEKAEFSPRVLELIRSMDFLCLGNQFDDKNIARAKLYLSSYNNLYPLTKLEFKNGLKAYYLKKVHSLWLEREHYLNKNDRIDVFAGGEAKMLSFFSKNLTAFIDNFSFY